MKCTWIAAGLVLAATTICAQSPVGFVHERQIDLSSFFNGTSGNGDSVADIAYDGLNAYLVGFQNGSNVAGTSSVGMIKIPAVRLSDQTTINATGLTLATAANAYNGGRDSKVVYINGNLYFGYGLGGAQASASTVTSPFDKSMIRKYDSNGIEDTSFGAYSGSDGMSGLSPIDMQSSTNRRFDSLSIDPGFNGSGPALAVVARDRGFMFRRDLTTGNAASGGNPTTSNSVAGLGNAYRDVTFDANGNFWVRDDQNVGFYARTGNGSVSAVVKKTSLTTTLLAQQNIQYLPQFSNAGGLGGPVFTSGPALLFNDKSNTTSGITVADLNGNTLGTLLGGEGGIGNLWNSHLLNFSYATDTLTGDTLLFVTNAGANTLDIYRIVPEPSSIASSLIGLTAFAGLLRRKKA